MKPYLRVLFLIVLVAGCDAQKPSASENVNPMSPPDEEENAYCPCVLTGESSWGVRFSLECFCENWNCPQTSAGILKPEHLTRVTTWTCSDGFVVNRSNGFDGGTFAFESREGLRFIGARAFYDFPAVCGTNEAVGGEFPEDISMCEKCILSHGMEYVAEDGRCLDESTLPMNFPSGMGGTGGEIDEAGMGGVIR